MMNPRVFALDTRVLRETLLFYIHIPPEEVFRMRSVIPLLGICIYQNQ